MIGLLRGGALLLFLGGIGVGATGAFVATKYVDCQMEIRRPLKDGPWEYRCSGEGASCQECSVTGTCQDVTGGSGGYISHECHCANEQFSSPAGCYTYFSTRVSDGAQIMQCVPVPDCCQDATNCQGEENSGPGPARPWFVMCYCGM